MKPFNLSDRPDIANRLIPRYYFTPDPEQDEAPYTSYLGTPVYSPLEFLKVSGTSRDNSLGVNGADGEKDVMLRIDTALITISQSRHIIKTPIPGRNGTVKEYIADGDFMIDIRGAIVGQFQNIYPREEVSLFIELLKLQKQIPVASDFLLIFEINSIVIEQYDISEKMGSRNEVPFQIQALSDLSEEIILNPNEP